MSHVAFAAPRVRLYRSAPLSLGTSLAPIAWDGESSNPSKVQFDHSTTVDPDVLTVVVPGCYHLYVHVRCAGAFLLNTLDVSLEVDLAGGGWVPRADPTVPATTGNGGYLSLCDMLDLPVGAKLRVQAGSNTTPALVVGETGCFFALRRHA